MGAGRTAEAGFDQGPVQKARSNTEAPAALSGSESASQQSLHAILRVHSKNL